MLPVISLSNTELTNLPGVTTLFAMESSPGASPVVTDITIHKGGKAVRTCVHTSYNMWL